MLLLYCYFGTYYVTFFYHSIKPHKCVKVNIIKSILKINEQFVVLRENVHWSAACSEMAQVLRSECPPSSLTHSAKELKKIANKYKSYWYY